MKQIGLIGGISWAATATYYRELNTLTQKAFGSNHSANLILRSLDMQIVLNNQSDKDALERLFESEGKKLAHAGARVIALASLTGHCYARLLGEMDVPLVRLDDCIARALHEDEVSCVGILATSIALGDQILMNKICPSDERAIVMPDAYQRRELDAVIFNDLAHGICSVRSAEALVCICEELARNGAQAIVFGTTELSIAKSKTTCSVPVLDAVEIHCRALLEAIAADNEGALDRG